MSKIMQARLKVDIMAVTEIAPVSDELLNARIIEKVQNEMVYKMRQELEKKMVALSKDDLVFELENTDLPLELSIAEGTDS